MALSQPINTDVVRLRLGVALDGLTVTVGPGRCFLPNAHRILSDGTVSTALVAPTASTWYYAYAYEASSGVLGMELSTTAPSTPYPSATSTARTKTGDTTRRYLGSAYVGTTSKLRPMKHTQCGSIGNLVTFSAASAAASVPVNLLSLFTAATATTVSLNPLVPATATHALLQVQNNSNRQVYLANPDQGPASATNYIASVNPGASDTMLIEIGSTQQLSVLLSSTGLLGTILGAVLTGSVSISVQGYLYDR
jgi:hypothetical protein